MVILPIRELTRSEIAALRPYAGTPMKSASMEAMLAACASGFVGTKDEGYAADVGFQSACISAMQRGKLSGEDMPTLLAKLSAEDEHKYSHRIRIIVQNSDSPAIAINVAEAARMLIRNGYFIDVLALKQDLLNWFSPEREPVKRWLLLLTRPYCAVHDEQEEL